jgi:hypothetical protein
MRTPNRTNQSAAQAGKRPLTEADLEAVMAAIGVDGEPDSITRVMFLLAWEIALDPELSDPDVRRGYLESMTQRLDRYVAAFISRLGAAS